MPPFRHGGATESILNGEWHDQSSIKIMNLAVTFGKGVSYGDCSTAGMIWLVPFLILVISYQRVELRDYKELAMSIDNGVVENEKKGH